MASFRDAVVARAPSITAASAAVQGVLLVGYAVSILYLAMTRGVAGPEAVASPTGVAVEAITFMLLGAGTLAVAVGRWRQRTWSAVPFVVVQLLALTVGVPMALGASGGVPAGILITAAALSGLAGQLVASAASAQDPHLPQEGTQMGRSERKSSSEL